LICVLCPHWCRRHEEQSYRRDECSHISPQT